MSLWPICGKIFEPLPYDTMYNFFSLRIIYFLQISLESDQILASIIFFQVTTKSLVLLTWGPKFGIFLDTSKAFGKVCYDGLVFDLHQNGICDKMINILEDLLSGRKQRVVLNGQCLSWVDIRVEVAQRSILGPLLFINNLSNNIKVNSDCLLMTYLCF